MLTQQTYGYHTISKKDCCNRFALFLAISSKQKEVIPKPKNGLKNMEISSRTPALPKELLRSYRPRHVISFKSFLESHNRFILCVYRVKTQYPSNNFVYERNFWGKTSEKTKDIASSAVYPIVSQKEAAMYICSCTKKREQDIHEMVQKGFHSWEEASEKSGAGRYCGSCLKKFRHIFQQKQQKKAS